MDKLIIPFTLILHHIDEKVHPKRGIDSILTHKW